jgi:hypothetical protein
MIKKDGYKKITYNGKSAYQVDGAKLFPVMDYGITTVRGSEIQNNANIKIGFKIEAEKNYVMLSGYLNNKLIPGTDEPAQDSYGDIPIGDDVYDIARLKSNPVALINHDNNAAGIAGNYIYLSETDQGLQFKEILRPLEDIHSAEVKDAVSAWGSGFGRAYSIGGTWYYDAEKSDPETGTWYLVKAILHEASHVAIGADPWALSGRPDTDKGKGAQCVTLEDAIREYAEGKGEAKLKQYFTEVEENGRNKETD